MTDEQIIKALECCGYKNCKQCPNFSEDIECSEKLIKLALDLINRQKAEIERLKGWQDLLKAEKHSLIKSEAIKKFENKILELFPSDKDFTTISRFTVKHIAKEMTEQKGR